MPTTDSAHCTARPGPSNDAASGFAADDSERPRKNWHSRSKIRLIRSQLRGGAARRHGDHRRQRRRRRLATMAAGQEVFDDDQQRILIADERQVIDARQLDEGGARNPRCEVAALLDLAGSDRRCDAPRAWARGSTAARRGCRSRRSCASAPPRRRGSRPSAGTPTTSRGTPDRRPPTARVPRGRPGRPTRR